MLKVETLIDISDKDLAKKIEDIGRYNIVKICFAVDSWEDGREEITKIIYRDGSDILSYEV